MREGGPRELRTKTLACWVMTIAALRFKTHHGPATNNASAPALSIGRRLEKPGFLRRDTAHENTKTGSAMGMKEAFDNNPSPIARPRPIQVPKCSELSLQSTNR